MQFWLCVPPKDPWKRGSTPEIARENAIWHIASEFFVHVNVPGKSHPWTNASVGGNFRRTFRTIGPYEFPQEKAWTNDWSIGIAPEIVWTNGAQSSLKVSVLTGIGP